LETNEVQAKNASVWGEQGKVKRTITIGTGMVKKGGAQSRSSVTGCAYQAGSLELGSLTHARPTLSTIFLFGLVAIFAAIEIGGWLGARASVQGDDNISTLEGAVIGLLALIVGFTFAMALARFEARRDAVLTEANAIGTTALRARLLPEPH